MEKFIVKTSFPKVLSVQSTVVYGYVGNKASVYGLQARQIEVDPLITCQLSNHTGYPVALGFKVEGEELEKVIEGMDRNGLLPSYSHIISGYIATTSFITLLPHAIRRIREARQQFGKNMLGFDPHCVFLCDPVLGDNGKLYVPEAFLEQYQNHLVPLADVITPNATEASALTGQEINSRADAQRVCHILHTMGPKLVILTSMPFHHIDEEQLCQKQGVMTLDYSTNHDITLPTNFDHDILLKCYPNAQTVQEQTEVLTAELLETVRNRLQPKQLLTCMISFQDTHTQQIYQWYALLPFYEGYIVGTGDLTASLIMAHLQHSITTNNHTIETIPQAIAQAIATIHVVVRATILRHAVLSFQYDQAFQNALTLYNQNHQPDEEPPTALPVPPLELWMVGVHDQFLHPTASLQFHPLAQ